MLSRERSRLAVSDPAISIFLAPEVRKARLFSPRELALLARARSAGFRVRDESDPLSAGGGDPKILGRLAVLTGDETDLVAIYQRVKGLARDRGVKKMDVLVCVGKEGAEGDSQGRRIFTQLFEVCGRFLDIDLVYLGTFSRGEKIRDSLAISKYLLHYQSGSRDSNKRQDAGMASS
jgi:hypothetical protein